MEWRCPLRVPPGPLQTAVGVRQIHPIPGARQVQDPVTGRHDRGAGGGGGRSVDGWKAAG